VTDKTEQRKYTRAETHIPVRYRKLRDGVSVTGETSITKNLSEGGIRFRTPEFVSMACRLIVELDVPMVAKTIKAISKVAWIQKTDSGKEFEVGNQFLEISKEDKEIVSKYIDSLSGSNNNHLSANQTETSAEK